MKALTLTILIFLLSLELFSQGKIVEITYQKGQNIRNIAKEYLNNENLWQEILKFNDLKKVTDLKPGMKIKIPSSDVSLAVEEIERSLKMIQQATEAGARLFASGDINIAIGKRNTALEEKKKSNWKKALENAQAATKAASDALEISRKENDVKAQAILNDLAGTVQDRKESDLSWIDSDLKKTLIEQQRLRTLSESSAEILFKDESRLRLSSNSTAVIQKMRYDILKNKQESKVSLVEGDIYALLSGNPRKKMDVALQGMKVDFNSTNFWVNKNEDEVKLANYDGEIEVSSGGETLMLGKNKGTRILKNQKPMRPEDLLPPVFLNAPLHGDDLYRTKSSRNLKFLWKPLPGAVAYWFELAFEKSSFSRIVLNAQSVRDTAFITDKIKEDGIYYWRVAAIDKNGFPGVKSEHRLVKIITDEFPPFLYIENPKDKSAYNQPGLHIKGETEENAELLINDRKVPVDDNGKFSIDFTLNPGENEIIFNTKDIAGNIVSTSRTVTYFPSQDVRLDLAEFGADGETGAIKSRGGGYNLRGFTEPDSRLDLKEINSNIASRTYADSKTGNFSLSIPLNNEMNNFNLKIETRSGNTSSNDFTVKKDITPPELFIISNLPKYTNEETIMIEGLAEGTDELQISRNKVLVEDDLFEYKASLNPGNNSIPIEANDSSGNQTKIELGIILDQESPRLISSDFFRGILSGGELIEFRFTTQDISGMKQTAQLEFSIGDKKFNQIARLNRVENVFNAIFPVPIDSKGKIANIKLTLTDYFSNTKIYDIK